MNQIIITTSLIVALSFVAGCAQETACDDLCAARAAFAADCAGWLADEYPDRSLRCCNYDVSGRDYKATDCIDCDAEEWGAYCHEFEAQAVDVRGDVEVDTCAEYLDGYDAGGSCAERGWALAWNGDRPTRPHTH